jgi:pimeloyl-ACP methyl ester carboxylesterase
MQECIRESDFGHGMRELVNTTEDRTARDYSKVPSRLLFVKVCGLNIAYWSAGAGRPLLLLHGWGHDSGSFGQVFDFLSTRYQVFALDLPGFGKSDPPPLPWGSLEYANLVLAFMDALSIREPSVIAHSFGARIVIQLASRSSPVFRSLVLVSAAGLKNRSIRLAFKRLVAKCAKGLSVYGGEVGKNLKNWIYDSVASSNYLRVPPDMKGTFVKIVNEDLGPLLSSISVPTLLIWGSQDQEMPLKLGERMQARIPKARLVVFSNVGHFPHSERPSRFLSVVCSFLDENV